MTRDATPETMTVRIEGEGYRYSTDGGITWSGWRSTRLQPLPGGYTISFEPTTKPLTAPLPATLHEFNRALLSGRPQ